MNYTDSTLLDILALLGGGRGYPLNDLTPHLLAAILWGGLTLYLALTSKGFRNTTDTLFIVSFCLLFLGEVSQASGALVHAKSLDLPATLNSFGSPLQRALCSSGVLVLTAAFLHVLLRQRQVTRHYLIVSFVVVALTLVYEVLPTAFAMVGNDAASSYLNNSQSRLITHLPIMVLLIDAMVKVLGSQRKIRWPILIVLCCLLTERLIGMLMDDHLVGLSPVLEPIKGNLHLWTIPLIAYVTLRIRHLESQRLDYGMQASERLEALGQLSSGIAHDFNNHLQIILGYTELAKSNGNLQGKQRVPLNRIEEAAQSAGALVNQLLAFSRGQPPKFQPVDINAIITRLTPMLSRLLGPDIRLVNNLDFNTNKINADVNMLEQVIINLVVNAKDAIVGTGTISIQTRALTSRDKSLNTGESGFERTQLLVTDTGQGMDEKTARRVFEPFFTTKPVNKGTGLGLSTVYNAIQKHQGSIFIKSELGRYTRVYMEFPVCNKDGKQQSSPPIFMNTTRSRGETVLLAEDETAIRDVASTLLSNAGYEVMLARDGQHAIEIMTTQGAKIDLCVFDVTMPGINGYDTFDRIADINPDIPVLFITGNTSRVTHARNHLPHLQKPFSKSSLFAQVRLVLDEAKVA